YNLTSESRRDANSPYDYSLDFFNVEKGCISMSIDSGRSTLRVKQRQERLELLLQAAEEVFVEKGYRDASMDEIAARIGIGTATIYSHFSSKEELMIAAILERGLRRVVQQVEEICAGAGSATERLARVFQFLVASDFFSRRFQMVYALGDSPEAQKVLLTSQRAMSENAQVFSQALSALIEQGKAAGEFQRGLETSTMLKALIGVIRAQSVTDTLLNSYEVSTNELLQVYLQGILTRAD
ncbi:MAG TPA: TetR/AcrR family transcriptional regulator, partial [Ktedonobacteraceae bacterium]|nr:TetR/AcrR family transcriptional regulator [Ktedonobacteraceae bacterium]